MLILGPVQRHKSALLNIFLDDNYLYDTDALFLSFQTNLNPQKLVPSTVFRTIVHKGTVQRVFDLQFFLQSNPFGLLSNGLNYFRFHCVIRFLLPGG